MKRFIFYLGVLFIPLLGSTGAFAQVPNISYSPATNALTLGTAFTITPGNGGGMVSTGGFSPIYSFSTITDPWDVTVDASGNVYTISETGNALYKITPTGTRTTLVSGGSLNAPTGIAIDAVGNIYISNFGTNQVLKYNTSGTLLSTINGFNQPYGISFDSSNNAYVGDVGSNTVIKISAGANTVTTYATGLVTPYGTAVDPSGNLYVSEYTTNNDIVKITPAGVKTVFATGFNAPRQLGSDAAGNIYVADYGNNVVKKITSAGVVSTITQATGLSTPRSIQVDAAGSVYIADYGNNRIKKLAATGWTISAALPAGLTFNTSTGKISGTPTVTFASTTYTVYAYNASGNDNTTITLSCTQTTADWKGTTSTAWTTRTNWSTGVVPTQYTAVRIGVVTFTNQPSLSTSKTVSSVTFGSVKQGVLSIATGATLTISDNLTINTGATGATIGGAGTAAVAMAPRSLVTITGTGKLTLTSPLSFTLQSDATGDATIGQITSTSIAGTAASSIKVERYISALRSYRLLSSPVYSATVSSNNVYSLNYIISNSFLTGTNGVSGGFDKAGNPSIYLFRESLTNPTSVNFTTGNYRGVKDINQSPTYNYLIDNESGSYNIPAGNGFLFFFRGSRSTTNPFVAGNASTLASTLSSSGTLNTGSITVHDWYTPASATFSYTSASPVAGLHLVGNPYASAIDWDTFQQTTTTTGIYGTANVSSAMYVLDPVTNNFGSYIAGSGGIGSSTFVSNVISSGQAFFILENASTSKLIFNESAKTSTQNTGTLLLMGKPANTTVAQYMHIQLGQGSQVDDQTLIRFSNQATLNYNISTDALFKPGFGKGSLSTVSNDKVKLSIKTIPFPSKQQVSIPLTVTEQNGGIYTLSLRDIVAMPRIYDVWLMDKYRNDSLDMRQNQSYQFQIVKSDTASFGSNRFTLVIRQNPGFAYRLLDFSASKLPEGRQTQVAWSSENEGNYTRFTVERSVDNGKTFDVVGGVTAADQRKYSLVDKAPVNGLNTYRLKQEDINSTITYSKLVTIEYSDRSSNIAGDLLSIYPNPAKGNLSLTIPVKATDNASAYNIKFMNSSGIIVKQVNSSQTTWQGSINDLKPGTYFVHVVDSKTSKLVGQNKFVKL